MRPIPFLILAYVSVCLLTALRPFVHLGSAHLLFPLIAAVFVWLYAPRDVAIVGGAVIGLLQDGVSPQPLGTWALLYLFTGLLIGGSKRGGFGDHPITFIIATAFAGLSVCIGLTVLGLVRAETRTPMTAMLLSVLLTALVSPLLLWPLQKSRRAFGIRGYR